MADQSDFLAPLSAAGSQGMLRDALVSRVPYVIADTETPEDFVALDVATGGMPWALVFEGRVFALDPDDATTAHDGITTIVTNDGYRFKVETVAGSRNAVLSNVLTTPPASPAMGASYLVPPGAVGDWASHPDDIAVWTARGWSFVPPEIGMLVYVESASGFFHYDEAGDWVSGLGVGSLPANTVAASSMIGGRTHWVVVNQTTNTPPGSPASGVAYIVGPSPTGAWAGQTGKIAVWQGSAWVFYSPAEGWTAYDQAMNVNYVFNGSWVSQQSGYSGVRIISATGTSSPSSSGTGAGSVPSATNPPISTGPRAEDPIGSPINIQADYAGQQFEVTYINSSARGIFDTAGSGGTWVSAIAVFLDSEAQARDWYLITTAVGSSVSASAPLPEYTFVITLGDTAPHQLKIMITTGRSAGTQIVTAGGTSSFVRRRVIIRKVA